MKSRIVQMFLRALILCIAAQASACLTLEDPFVETLTAIVGTNPTDTGSTTATTPMTFKAFTNNGTVLTSADGITWTSASVSGGVSSIGLVTRIGTTLYGIDGATNGIIWTSTDNGSTWSQITVSGSLTFTFQRIAACSTTIMVTYNDTGATELRGFVSTDSGSTWSGPLTIHSTSTGQLQGLACDGARFHVGMTETPFARYADAPYTAWTAAAPNPTNNALGTTSPIAAGNSNVVFLYTATGPLERISTNSGVGYAAGENLGFDFGNNNTVVAYQNSRFFIAGFGSSKCSFGVSTNGGSGNWTFQKPACATTTTMSGIAGNGSSTVVYVGTNTSNVPILYYSADNGATVTQATLPGSIGTSVQTVVYIP